MDVVHRRSSASSPSGSALNPNAPLFVPMAYRAVEDFSDQWFQLVESSASFRGYWFLQQQQQQQQQQNQHQQRRRSDGEDQRGRDLDDVLLADEDSLFHGYQPGEEEKRYARDVAAFQSAKWGGPLSPVNKAVQFASHRTSPWTLQA